MLELKETYLHREERALDLLDQAAWRALTEKFSPAAVYLLEATDRASLGPLSAFDGQWAGCFSLIVCDESAELRLEKEPFSGRAQVRTLREYGAENRPAEAERCWVRRDRHPLRRPIAAAHAVISPPRGGDVWLEAREYFKPSEEDGWLTRAYIRLAGLLKGEN